MSGVAMLAFTPFVQPLPVWDYWPWLLLPLVAAVSIVYKSIKCHEMRQVPREASVIFGMIIGGILLAALALFGLVKVMAG